VEQPAAEVQQAPPSAPQENFTPPPLEKKTVNDTISSLDALIDSAPEQAEAPPIPEPEPAPKETPQTSPSSEPDTTSGDKDEEVQFDEDEFYNAPLITSALEMFEATLKPA
jgi:hypothetical protein